MNDIRAQAAVFAINRMLKGAHFDICTIRDAATAVGIQPRKDSYDVLRLLHCVNYVEMPDAIRHKIPELIADCLGDTPAFQFNDSFFSKQDTFKVIVDNDSKKSKISKLLPFSR